MLRPRGGGAERTNRRKPLPPRERQDRAKRAVASMRAPRLKTALSHVPRNQLDSPTIDLLKTPVYLFLPRLFSIVIDSHIQAFEKSVGQSRARLGRKCECVLQQFRSFS